MTTFTQFFIFNSAITEACRPHTQEHLPNIAELNEIKNGVKVVVSHSLLGQTIDDFQQILPGIKIIHHLQVLGLVWYYK
jgi:hypothetical protein